MPLQVAGILEKHELAISSIAISEDTFIFIRPTTQDSMVLIAEGFPTKSMDVHLKSSDWGPMAGFVPVDPAFDKSEGVIPKKRARMNPNPQIDTHLEHNETHNAEAIQLAYSETVLNKMIERGKISKIVEKEKQGWVGPFSTTRNGRAFNYVTPKQVTLSAGGATASDAGEARWYKATATHQNGVDTEFCLTKKEGRWLVWYKMPSPADVADPRAKWGRTSLTEIELCPLHVFAYKVEGELTPVTGDYDIWMVAPRHTHLGEHMAAMLNVDSHGKSAATAYVTGLIKKLNAACGCARNPVFRHGAEAQNYGFVQYLDPDFAMFAPSGTRKMVPLAQLPRALYEIRIRGYLVYWNKRYGEHDPHVMGSAAAQQDLARMNNLRRWIRRLAMSQASGTIAQSQQMAHENLQGSIRNYQASKSLPAKERTTAARMVMASALRAATKDPARMIEIGSGKNDKLVQMRQFYEQMKAWAFYCDTRLMALEPGDFKAHPPLPKNHRAQQMYVEETIVQMAEQDGQANPQRFAEMIQTLQTYA